MCIRDRFYDPDQGRILYDGMDVKDITLESLRDNISIVLQLSLIHISEPTRPY